MQKLIVIYGHQTQTGGPRLDAGDKSQTSAVHWNGENVPTKFSFNHLRNAVGL